MARRHRKWRDEGTRGTLPRFPSDQSPRVSPTHYTYSYRPKSPQEPFLERHERLARKARVQAAQAALRRSEPYRSFRTHLEFLSDPAGSVRGVLSPPEQLVMALGHDQKTPDRPGVCTRREQRRQVLHALGFTGAGTGAGTPRFTAESKIRCRR